MRNKALLVMGLVLCAASLCLAVDIQDLDKAWQERNGLTTETANLLTDGYEDLLARDSQDYQVLWKYSRALNYVGMYLLSTADSKKKVFMKAKDAAFMATQVSPDKIEGHIWLAVALGNWGEVNGPLKSLSLVPEIERNMNEVLTKDGTAVEAVAYRVLGRLYFRAPGPPLSVGDLAKSEEYLRQAIEIAPLNKKSHLFLADTLLKKNEKQEALDLVDKALAMPLRPGEKLEELSDISELKDLRVRIVKAMGK